VANFKFEVNDTWPNILLVYGEKIFDNDYRVNIRDYLYSLRTEDSCPVQKGTHDFWITYAATTSSVGGGEHAHEDMSVTPRPMRGIIRMGNSIPVDARTNFHTIQEHLSTLLQEVGHQWLVPRDLSIQKDIFWPSLPTKPYQMPGFEENALSLEGDGPFYGVPLLGRANGHWSAFFKSDRSVFDGINWENDGVEDEHQIWKESQTPPSLPRQPIVPTPAGLPAPALGPIELIHGKYCDLDLLVMGIKDPNEAYRTSNNTFSWIEPRLIAPLNYFAGLCIAFSQDDFLYFGFYRDHRQLANWASRRSDQPPLSRIFPMSGYRPLRSKFDGVALRIVRRGDNYYVQARLSNPQDGVSLLEEIEPLVVSPPGSPLDRFRTLATLTHSGEPKAMGLIVKTSVNDIVCDAAFRHIEVLTGTPNSGSETTILTNSVPPDWDYSPANGYDALPPFGSLVFNRPIKKARVRIGKGWINDEWLFMTTPYLTLKESGGWDDKQSYDHSASIDEAPKILTKVPTGDDFAVATLARINRSSFCPWYGSVPNDTRIWGKENSASTQDVFLSEYSRQKQTAPDMDNKYKFAFIIAAERRTDIEERHLLNLDTMRQWWDEAFDVVTLGRRHSNSKL
jgi:hypothetical protein